MNPVTEVKTGRVFPRGSSRANQTRYTVPDLSR